MLKSKNCRGDFEYQITKPYLSVLRLKPRNRHPWFCGQTKKTVATDFEAKLRKTVPWF
jgi:hypothetical protein